VVRNAGTPVRSRGRSTRSGVRGYLSESGSLREPLPTSLSGLPFGCHGPLKPFLPCCSGAPSPARRPCCSVRGAAVRGEPPTSMVCWSVIHRSHDAAMNAAMRTSSSVADAQMMTFTNFSCRLRLARVPSGGLRRTTPSGRGCRAGPRDTSFRAAGRPWRGAMAKGVLPHGSTRAPSLDPRPYAADASPFASVHALPHWKMHASRPSRLHGASSAAPEATALALTHTSRATYDEQRSPDHFAETGHAFTPDTG